MTVCHYKQKVMCVGPRKARRFPICDTAELHSALRERSSGAPSRLSPGRKAYFSSVHPAPVSWIEPAGFTLIEVLLALAISAIVLVAISFAFAGALQLREHSVASLDQSLPVERALDLMRRDLENVVPPGLILAGPLQSGAFEGGVDANDGIQLYTTTGLITPNEPWADIQKVTYGLQSSSDSTNSSKDLIRAVTRNLLATGPEDEDDQLVMKGVQSLSFSYFDGAQWLDTWDDTTQTNLPLAVRVNVQLATSDSGSAAPKPVQLLVPLMAQVDTNLLNAWESMTNSATASSSATGGRNAN